MGRAVPIASSRTSGGAAHTIMLRGGIAPAARKDKDRKAKDSDKSSVKSTSSSVLTPAPSSTGSNLLHDELSALSSRSRAADDTINKLDMSKSPSVHQLGGESLTESFLGSPSDSILCSSVSHNKASSVISDRTSMAKSTPGGDPFAHGSSAFGVTIGARLDIKEGPKEPPVPEIPEIPNQQVQVSSVRSVGSALRNTAKAALSTVAVTSTPSNGKVQKSLRSGNAVAVTGHSTSTSFHGRSSASTHTIGNTSMSADSNTSVSSVRTTDTSDASTPPNILEQENNGRR